MALPLQCLDAVASHLPNHKTANHHPPVPRAELPSSTSAPVRPCTCVYAQEAHARRGAPWTFDAAKFVAAVRRVREAGAGSGAGGGGGGGAVRVPSFDHGVGDPVEDDIVIPPLPAAAVVLVEGEGCDVRCVMCDVRCAMCGAARCR